MMSLPTSPTVDELATVALLNLPNVGPRRLQWLCEGGRAPSQVLASLASGSFVPLSPSPRGVTAAVVQQWIRQARSLDLADLERQLHQTGTWLLTQRHPHWPFGEDPEPPAVLFGHGATQLLERRVGIVGTRRCSSIGRSVAFELGYQLAQAGIGVVSGLALGIDAAAHQGAIAALRDGGSGSVIGVVGSGLDCIYPPKNADLWRDVSVLGTLLSETPLGTAPSPWRFPARNRLVAGLVDLIVVVESHEVGGALTTVTEAADRGVTVGAVPGSVRSASCRGSNQLLVDGCPPIRDSDDILDVMGWQPSSRSAIQQTVGEAAAVTGPVGELQNAIVAELANGSCHLDQLVASLGVASAVMEAVQELVVAGHVRLEGSTVLLL